MQFDLRHHKIGYLFISASTKCDQLGKFGWVYAKACKVVYVIYEKEGAQMVSLCQPLVPLCAYQHLFPGVPAFLTEAESDHSVFCQPVITPHEGQTYR